MTYSKILSLVMLFFTVNSVFAQQNLNDKSVRYTSPQVNPNNTVTFRLYAPNAKQVKVKGDWNDEPAVDMKRQSDGSWTWTSPQLASDLYIYTYQVDGTKMIDPSSTFTLRDVNSLFSMFYIGGGKGDYYQVQHVPHGDVIRTWYDSELFGCQHRFTMYLPAAYHQNPEQRFPVLYLLHGSGGDEEAWITLGQVSRILDNLIAQGKATPMIVVMPNGNAEYAAAPGESEENLSYPPKTMENMTATRDSRWEQSIPELVGYVDGHYRTKACSSQRSLAGLSMGGYHTFWTTANNPGLFDYIGLFSATILTFGKEKTVAYYQNRQEKLADLQKDGFKLYNVYVGNTDFLYEHTQKDLRPALEAAGIKYNYIESGRGHLWTNWRAYLLDFVPQLFK